MLLKKETYKENWINDHLDLYLLACQLNDKSWQDQLLNKLSKHTTHITEETRQITRDQLWKEFLEINKKILKLYDLMKTTCFNNRDTLLETVIHLKNKKVEVRQKIVQLEK